MEKFYPLLFFYMYTLNSFKIVANFKNFYISNFFFVFDFFSCSREKRCPYTNCVCVGLLLSPALPSTVTLSELKIIKSAVGNTVGILLFTNVTDLKEVKQQSDWPGNFTQLELPTEHDGLF